MSAEPVPPPEEAAAAQKQASADLRWLGLFTLVMVVTGAAVWLVGPWMMRETRRWRGHWQASAVQEHVRQGNWEAAGKALRSAWSSAPDDPAVVRAALDYTHAVGSGEPRSSIALVKQAQRLGISESRDEILMGSMLARQGEVTAARRVYEALSTEAKATWPAEELLAEVLWAQGLLRQAERVRLQALRRSQTTKGEKIRLWAELETRHGSPSEQAVFQMHLWALAAQRGTAQLAAIDLLTRMARLSPPQVQELEKIVAKGLTTPAETDLARLRVRSAQMRLRPQEREEILAKELTQWQGQPLANTVPLLTWLAEEGQQARVLRLVPEEGALKLPEVLKLYVNALRQQKRWKDLDRLLKSSKINTTASASLRLLWQTEVLAQLQPAELTQVRQRLARLLAEAAVSKQPELARQTAELAERLGHWDLARQGYASLAETYPELRLAMLLKVHEMAEHEHDSTGMLTACQTLLQLQPENLALTCQGQYLRALLGVDLETLSVTLNSMPSSLEAGMADLLALTRALLAFRQGHPQDIEPQLRKIRQPSSLPAGKRAVYAGLLQVATGDTAQAFKLLEGISPALLLPEESSLAKRVL